MANLQKKKIHVKNCFQDLQKKPSGEEKFSISK